MSPHHIENKANYIVRRPILYPYLSLSLCPAKVISGPKVIWE